MLWGRRQEGGRRGQTRVAGGGHIRAGRRGRRGQRAGTSCFQEAWLGACGLLTRLLSLPQGWACYSFPAVLKPGAKGQWARSPARGHLLPSSIPLKIPCRTEDNLGGRGGILLPRLGSRRTSLVIFSLGGGLFLWPAHLSDRSLSALKRPCLQELEMWWFQRITPFSSLVHPSVRSPIPDPCSSVHSQLPPYLLQDPQHDPTIKQQALLKT